MGSPRLRYLEDAENDLRDQGMKRWRQKANKWRTSTIKKAKIPRRPYMKETTTMTSAGKIALESDTSSEIFLIKSHPITLSLTRRLNWIYILRTENQREGN
jgi:hypothetical protein